MKTLQLDDAHATDALGRALAFTRPLPGVLHLAGDLGAGKSTLARALLRALGVIGPIRSPTYTLVERYPVAGGEAWHLDLYRIGDPGELEFLGLDPAEAGLWLIEWPDRAGAALPPPDLVVELVHQAAGREARMTPRSPAGGQWLTSASAAFTAQIFTAE